MSSADAPFPCTQCGACCRRAGQVSPELDRGDGACLHLVEHEDGRATCGIYAERPTVCRVDEMWESNARVWRAISRDDWHAANLRQCRDFQEQDGTPLHLRVLP